MERRKGGTGNVHQAATMAAKPFPVCIFRSSASCLENHMSSS